MKTYFVVGHRSGIGRALTELLLNRGDAVVGLSRSESGLAHPKLTELQADVLTWDGAGLPEHLDGLAYAPGSINLKPRWSPTGTALSYVGYAAGNGDLYVADLAKGAIRRVSSRPGLNTGGAFSPLSRLPTVVQWVAKVFPLWHGVVVARGLTTGGLAWGDALGHLGYAAVWVVVGCVVSTRRLAVRLCP